MAIAMAGYKPQAQERAQEDDLSKALKVMQLFGTGYGIKDAIDKNNATKETQKLQQEEMGFKRDAAAREASAFADARGGVLSQRDKIEKGASYDWVPEGTRGATAFRFRTGAGDNDVETTYGMAKKPAVDSEARGLRTAIQGLQAQKLAQDIEDAKNRKTEKEKALAVPGFERTGEVAPQEAEVAKFRDATATAGQLRSKLGQLRDAVNKYGSFEYGGEGATDMQTLATEIQLLSKSPALYDLGVLNGPDLTILQKITADPSSIDSLFTRDSSRLKQIDNQLASIDNRISTKASSLGYKTKNEALSPGPVAGSGVQDQAAFQELAKRKGLGTAVRK